MSDMRQLLDNNPAIAAWTMKNATVHEYQLYFSRNECVCKRQFDEQIGTVRIFTPSEVRNQRKVMGLSRFRILPIDSETSIKEKIELAIKQAYQVSSRYWYLPDPISEIPAVDCCDLEALEHPMESLERVAETILAAITNESGIELSQMELYLTDTTTEFFSSLQVPISFRESQFTLYAVLLSAANGDSTDVKIERTRRSPFDINFTQLISECAQYARDSLNAQLPESRKRSVLMSHDVLDTLFNPFIAHASGSFHAKNLTLFKPTIPIIDACRGETLTLISDGQLPHGNLTRAFDDDGVPAQVVTIVENGIFHQPACTQEHACYLGLPGTGAFSNRRVKCGAHSQAELQRSEPGLLEIVSFSSCIPEDISGDFVGEIRMGYENRHGKRIPVKGGAVSGNLFEAFRNVYFSREQVFRGDYLGPAAVLLPDLTVSGA